MWSGSIMNFRFPDIASFPGNDFPTYPSDDDVKHLFAHAEHFKSDLVELAGRIEMFLNPDAKESVILKEQMKRILISGMTSLRPLMFRGDLHPDECCHDLTAHGVHSTQAPVSGLQDLFGPHMERLYNKKPSEKHRDYDRATSFVDPGTLIVLQKFLEPYLDGITKYKGGDDFAVRSATLHCARPGDKHHYQTFQDLPGDNSLLNLHVDPKPDVMKALIYLNDVGEDNGPFQMIRGSAHWEYDEVERIFAWGTSVGNYCNSPAHRKVANAFPTRFRKNAIVGRLIPDKSKLCKTMTEALTTFTSDEANLIIFDPTFNFHRGGLCKSGHRFALQVVLR
jgi:hypothetical protein